jgi:hypothetical protein
MSRGERQRYLRTIIGDGIVDVVESYVLEGKISPQEAKHQYRLLGNYMDNADLQNRKHHVKAVAARLRKLIAARAENPIPTPVIPGPQPGEHVVPAVETNVIVGTFGQKALSRKRQVA